MAEYLIYFNQQWVGDHTEEWFRGRGPLAMEVIADLKAAGEFVFAGGLEEETDTAFSADATSGSLTFTDGPYAETKEHVGGFWLLEAADLDEALAWGRKAAVACRAPVEVRAFFRHMPTEAIQLHGRP